MSGNYQISRKGLIGTGVGLIVLFALAVSALPSLAAHSQPLHAQQLAWASFTDGVDMQVRVKLDGRRTRVINVREASGVLTVRMELDPGAPIGWHTHPGPVVVSVVEGELTYVNADDCVKRVYGEGDAFIDPGQGNVHMAKNTATTEINGEPVGVETVLVATFFSVPALGQQTIAAPAPAGCDPFGSG